MQRGADERAEEQPLYQPAEAADLLLMRTEHALCWRGPTGASLQLLASGLRHPSEGLTLTAAAYTGTHVSHRATQLVDLESNIELGFLN